MQFSEKKASARIKDLLELARDDAQRMLGMSSRIASMMPAKSIVRRSWRSWQRALMIAVTRLVTHLMRSSMTLRRLVRALVQLSTKDCMSQLLLLSPFVLLIGLVAEQKAVEVQAKAMRAIG